LDLVESVRNHLGIAIYQHRLTTVAVTNEDVLLVGQGYALDFSRDFDDVSLRLIEPCKEKMEPKWYSANMLLLERSTRSPRPPVESSQSLDERLDSCTRTIATVLVERCQDILSGDFSWLHEKKKKDRAAWAGYRVDATVQKALFSIWRMGDGA